MVVREVVGLLGVFLEGILYRRLIFFFCSMFFSSFVSYLLCCFLVCLENG